MTRYLFADPDNRGLVMFYQASQDGYTRAAVPWLPNANPLLKPARLPGHDGAPVSETVHRASLPRPAVHLVLALNKSCLPGVPGI